MKRRRFRALRLFVRHWHRSRSHRDLLWGLPALVAIILVIQAITFVHWRTDQGDSMDRYLVAARAAVVRRDWREADLYYRKVLQKSPDHAPAIYELTKVAGALRQTARRHSLLERLQLITDEPRVPLWVAELLGSSARNVDELAAAIVAFDEAEKSGLDTGRLRVSLAVRYLEMGEHEAVVGLLDSEESLTAEACLILAKSWQVLLEPAKAATAARRTVVASQSMSLRDRKLLQAQAYAILGQFRQAIGLLAMERHGAEVEQLLADVYSLWLDEIVERKREVSSQDWVLLEYGLERVARRPELLSQFFEFSQVVSRQSLDVAFTKLKAPVLVHLTLGLRAFFADDLSLAGFHLDLAQRLDDRGRSFLKACLEHPSLVDDRAMLSQHVEES